MKVYMDSSVVLRMAFGQADSLTPYGPSDIVTTSTLTRLECLRAVDRTRLQFDLSDEAVSERRAFVFELLQTATLVRMTDAILDRAAEPFPTLIASLDAIHLASALATRAEVPELVFATHDSQLGNAARAMGFRVIGLA